MKSRQWKKLICLLLALEMLCAPLTPTAMSVGAEPEDTGQGPPAPILEERPDTTPSAEPTPVPTEERTPAPAPTVVPTTDVTPTVEPTPTPTTDVTPAPAPTVVPTTDVTPTAEPTSTPTTDVTPNPEPTVVPTTDVTPTAEPTPTPTTDVTPTPEPTETEEPVLTTEPVESDGELDADSLQAESMEPMAVANPAWRYIVVSPNYYKLVKLHAGNESNYVFESEETSYLVTIDKGRDLTINPSSGIANFYSYPVIKGLRDGRVPNYEFDGWYAHRFGSEEETTAFYTTGITTPATALTKWVNLTKETMLIGAETGVKMGCWDRDATVTITSDINGVLESGGIISGKYKYTRGTTNYPVLLLYANWVPSKNATITEDNFSLRGLTIDKTATEDSDLQLFTQSIQGKNTTAATSGDSNGTTADDLGKTDWDPDNVTAYYTRTLPEQEYAEFTFDTYEPGARVTVTLQFGGKTVYQETVSVPEQSGEESDTVATLVKTLRNGPSTTSEPNSWANPARAIWTLTVPLAYSDGAAGVDSIYNVVTIKVESPDAVATNSATAENTKTYTFNIQRLRDPKLEQETGNTRAGLAEDTWSTLPRVYRYNGGYGAGAWPNSNDNPDDDKYAVAVYLGNAVELPGLTLIDSEGFRTELGKGFVSGTGTLKYRLKVNGVKDKLTTDVFTAIGTDNDPRTSLYYLGSTFTPSNAQGDLESGKLTLDLKNTAVCPGRYSMEYEFADPVTGKTYHSGSHYYEEDNAATFARTLLILSIPGDVDMDGAVTTADAIALKEAVASKNSFVYKNSLEYQDACLFAYRVCDVNGDGNVDEADVDALYHGFAPSLSNYFYTPWNWRELAAVVAQKDRVTATGDDGTKAHLTVEYLGIEVPTEGVADQTGVELNNVFWVAVKLAGVENLSETALADKVKAFTISLSYNSTYLNPALEEAGSKAEKVYTYAAANKDTWGGDYDYSHSVWDQENKAHSSKATTELTGESDSFREIQVIVELKDGAGGKTLGELKDGYVLKLPFELVAHPDAALGEPRLLEAALGMRELSLITRQDNLHTTTFAWSMVDDIYGNATRNLADYVDYCGADDIPFGEDRTPSVVILNEFGVKPGETPSKNAVYGEEFSFYIGNSDNINKYLPKGLSQGIVGGNSNGSITGIPQEVGTFEFYYYSNKTKRTRYVLVVEKAPLTVWVDDQEKYYGEDNPELTFSYDVSQLKAVDKETEPEFFAVSNQGTGTALKKLQGYTAPTVTTATTVTSLAGEYEILLDGAAMESDHYEFYFVDSKTDSGPEGQTRDSGAAEKTTESRGTLTVHKRPLWLQKITQTSVGNLFSEDTVLRLSERALASGYYRQGDFTLTTPELTDGKYNGLPLTAGKLLLGDDDLHITFDALFQADNKQYPYFEMNGAGQKFCDVTIDTAKLDETYGAAANYELLMLTASNEKRNGVPVDNTAQGLVLARRITAIRVETQLDNTAYVHGDQLNPSGLMVRVTYENKNAGGEGDGEVEYLRWSGKLFESNGLSVYWAWPDDKGGYTVGDKVGLDQELSRYVHDGAYLCVTADTFEQNEATGEMEATTLYAYTSIPLTVSKRELTLYLAKQDRYYGEDNAEFVVTYDVAQLAQQDQEGRTGFITDFDSAPLAGYQAPTLAVLDSRGRPVDRTTGVGSYTITISGAASSDYNIRYAAVEDRGTAAQTAATNVLTIHPRPIIVTKINARAPFIYADTETVAGTGTTTIDNVELQYIGNVQEFSVTRPEEGNRYYYQTQRVEDRYETAQGTVTMPLTGDAVLSGDMLELSYRAEYVRDNENTRGDPYFTLSPDDDYEDRPVLVKDITLLNTGSAKNYTLVFARNDNASAGLPGSIGALVEEERRTTGEVRWRPIQKLEIISVPKKLEYTYGEVLELSGLAVRITSENNGVGGGKPLVRNVEYMAVTVGDIRTNTFAQAGLWVSWNSSNGDLALGGEYVTVTERNGATLVVSAQRQKSHRLLTENIRQTVVVHKKALALTAQPQYKYYGESNREYGFTFQLSDLAIPDREKVAGISLTGTVTYDEFSHADGNSFAYSLTPEGLAAELAKHPATSVALEKINEAYESTTAYVGPVFSSGCTAHSDVTGNYPLTLSGGAMANYEFTYQASTTTVFRRPIQVDKIKKDPVYTPFAGTETGKTYTTECFYANGVVEPRQDFSMESLFTQERGMDNPYDNAYVQQMGNKKLQRNAVDVLPGDTVGLQMKLTLTTSDVEEKSCGFTVSDMQLTSGSANYCLYYRNADTAAKREPINAMAIGNLETRNITSVEIVSEPRFDYTYNQLGQGQNLGVLDLSQLRIKITYQGEEGQIAPNEIVTASEKEGIYISYWPADKAVSSNSADWQTIVRDYRPAATGDHLTIAKDASGFAHNGMKLIISAQATSDLDFVKPVVTTGTIKVSPLELTYRLSAEDKVYDGSKKATGTITLLNVYAGDEVYVDTGVTYADFAKYIRENGYSFTSAADSARTALRFDFKDADVAYQTAPTHDNYGALDTKVVEVRGINSLRGKDAANYKINDMVTETTQQIAGRDGAPRATITKAQRTLQDLTILLTTDMNTNTVEVSVAEDVLSKGDSKDVNHNKKPELHYEYALEYIDPAAADGTSTIILPWQDGKYFGGEAVTIENDDAEGSAEMPEGAGAGQAVNGADRDFGKREPLPRDTYFRALVRIAESHNYEVSNFVVSVEDLIAAVAEAEAAGTPEPDETLKGPTPMEPSALGKTYRYRLDLVSTYEVKTAQGGQAQRFEALEGVWFNDIEEYKDSRALDRAVDNMETVRYHAFYRDKAESKTLSFPLVMERELQAGEAGDTPEGEPLPENTLQIYVSLQTPVSNVAIRSIKLSAEELTVTLGDAPMQLTVEYTPKSVTTKQVTWSSSDENVVTVDKNGILTFVGVGEAVVTATTRNGKTASVVVTVRPPEESPFKDTLFNVEYTGTYLELDEDYNFRPDDRMTRGEAAEILVKFLTPAEDGELEQAEAFLDVDSTKSYADAVALMRTRGIVEGVGGNCFDGERYVTREEVAAMLGRMLLLGRESEDRVHVFADCTEETAWGYAYVDDLADAGIAQGRSEARFHPKEAATRAELAVFIARILVTEAREDAPSLLIPADMTEEHWAYSSVLRAVNTAIQLKGAE